MGMIYLDDAIEAIASRDETDGTYIVFSGKQVIDILKGLPSAEKAQLSEEGTTFDIPSAEPKTPSNGSITCVKSEKMHDRTMGDLISRQDAIRLAEQGQIQGFEWQFKKLCMLPSAEKAQLSEEDATKDATSDLISRKKALDVIKALQTYKLFEGDDMILVDKADVQTELMMLPSAGGCKCPCAYREPCDYCHYDGHLGMGCPAERRGEEE